MEQKTINVAFNINDNYLPYCAVTIASILKNASPQAFFNFYVLSIENLSKDLASIKITGYENFKIYNITNELSELRELHLSSNVQKHVSIDTYLRCYVPIVLKDIEKCIILDVDLIVNTDIEKLYNIDLKEFYVAAVVEDNFYGKFIINDRKKNREMFLKTYHLKNDLYFNTGVTLFNLKKIREDHAERLLIDTTVKYCHGDYILFADQDCINIAYQGFERGKMLPIDIRWNPFQINGIPSNNLYIMHWCGGNKPWKNFNVPHIKVYLEYAKLTQYYPKIRDTLLGVVEEKLQYLNTKLPYKKYVRRLKMFDVRIFGRDIFPKTIGHCRRKINEFMQQKREREIYLNYLTDLKHYLINK